MHPSASWVLLSALALGGLSAVALGCGGPAAKPDIPADPDPPRLATDDGDALASGSNDNPSGIPSAPPEGPTVNPAPQPQDQDYEITPRDCDTLAGAYGRSWENDELEKLNAKGMSGKQRDAAAAALHQGAVEARDNWASECSNMVGSPLLLGRLKCASKARSLQRFNDCWDGKVE